MRGTADLRPYQRRMVDKALELTHLLIGAGLGLGKTAIALNAVAQLEAVGDARRVLIVAPLNVAKAQWHTEAAEWAFSAHLDFALCLGTAKQREAAIESDATITVVNVENLVWLLNRYPIKTKADGSVVCAWPWDCVVLDESYLFSNASAKRFKHLRFYTRRKRMRRDGSGTLQDLSGTPIKRLILLTATPAPNGLQKLWSQLFLVDDGERLHHTFSAFENAHFHLPPNASRHTKPILNDGSDVRIYEAVNDRVFVLRSEDYLDLPPIVHKTYEVELPAKVRKQYRTLERDYMLVLDDGKDIYAPSAAALQAKLQQIANGAAYVGDRRDPGFDGSWSELHTAKLDALEEIAAVTEDNLLVTYWFRHDLERLQARFPDAETLTAENIDDVLPRWNRGEIRMLFLHPMSGGVGINAQHGGATMIWFGPTWDNYLWEQTLGRLHRSGQTRGVTVICIVVANSVEQRVARGLQNKASVQDSLLEYLSE